MQTIEERAHLLESNRALRVWAEGLRAWSRSTREASSCARAHTHELLGGSPRARAAQPRRDLAPGALCMSPIPSLGTMSMAELVAVLVDRHGLDSAMARRQLERAVLMSGLPQEIVDVPAADAFQLIDWVVEHGP